MRLCEVKGCSNKHDAKGYCTLHYRRFLRTGTAELRSRPARLCSLADCNEVHYCKSYCKRHYASYKKHGDPYTMRPRVVYGPEDECNAPNCDRRPVSKGYCDPHAKRASKGQCLNKPLQNSGDDWIREEVTYDGYVRVFLPGRRVKYQHRMVMEESLGRELLAHENVHHINGVREDNRLENLELWSTSQPAGQRVSDKIQFALDIIELYGENPNEFR
jgi:hypothetical protein